MALTLARHSDIRLTLGMYRHVGIHDQALGVRTGEQLTAEFHQTQAAAQSAQEGI